MIKILQNTLLYKLYITVISLYNYINDYNNIKDVFYSVDFKFLLKKYLNVNIKKDWLGRLYGVVNPLIDKNNNLNVDNLIIELDDEQTNDSEYVKYWVHRQLDMVGTLFKITKMYDYINLSFKKVRPYNADNYLIVFDIVSRKLFVKALKRLLTHMFIYAIIVLMVVLYLHII